MQNLLFIALLFCSTLAYAQADLSKKYAETITVSDLDDYLSILSSNALGGRETGEAGQKMAAAYIEHFFEANDLEPIVYTPSGSSYLQSFDLVSMKPGEAWIKTESQTYENFEDIVYTGHASHQVPIKSSLVFVGHGRPQDYQAIDANGKNVLIYCKGDRVDRSKKADIAAENGAAQIFMMQYGDSEAFKRTAGRYKRYLTHGRLSLPPDENETEKGYFMIPTLLGAEILNTSEKKLEEALEQSESGSYKNLLKLQSQEIIFYVHQDMQNVSTENVLGFIEGSDKKDEYVIITAHYDHIGINDGEVYNGADDDGSGTVAVMEIAQAFAQAKKEGHGPRRSILFMAVTGEEKGLLGSSYYVNNPVIPLEKTITNLNIDMIGRIDEVHESNPEYVYLIGSDKLSKGLHDVSEWVNSTYTNLELDYKYNDENDPNRYYYRSDHYNFAKNNIPVIFYFNGTHADYHKATDTIDKIAFDLLEKRSRLVFHTAWEVANREESISVDVQPNDIDIDGTN
jgi:hypothetical protein